MKRFFLGIFVVTMFFLACKKSSSTNTTVDCSTNTAKYAADVSPIITSKCATNSGCHASGATNSGGVLTTYSQVAARKSNIRTSVNNGSMPQGSSLTTTEKSAIICWIDNGALNN